MEKTEAAALVSAQVPEVEIGDALVVVPDEAEYGHRMMWPYRRAGAHAPAHPRPRVNKKKLAVDNWVVEAAARKGFKQRAQLAEVRGV
jgi:hypothetical protein